MSRSRFTRLAALVAALVLAAPLAAVAQPALGRTPNLAGAWVPPAGVLFFDFLHRFEVGSAPAYPVTNIPNFYLGTGLWSGGAAGVNYSTQTVTVPGASQELEVFAAQRLLDEADGAPLSLGLKGAFNVTAFSPDVEANVVKQLGPVSLFGTLRGLGNYRYMGSPRFGVGGGLSLGLTPYVALSADGLIVPQGTAFPVLGAGLQLQIPNSPHSVSLQVSNASTTSIHGSSVDTGTLRYGFDFTVPLTPDTWLTAVKPAAPKPTKAPEAPAAAEFDAKGFYAANCIGCHGGLGQGGFGPDLRPVEARGDAFIATRIRKGSPKGMPAYANLSDAELAQLVAYAKKL